MHPRKKENARQIGMKFQDLYKKWTRSELKKGDFIFATEAARYAPTNIHLGALEDIKRTNDLEAVYQNLVYLTKTYDLLKIKEVEGYRKEGEISSLGIVGDFELISIGNSKLGNPERRGSFEYIYFMWHEQGQLKELMEEMGFKKDEINTYFGLVEDIVKNLTSDKKEA